MLQKLYFYFIKYSGLINIVLNLKQFNKQSLDFFLFLKVIKDFTDFKFNSKTFFQVIYSNNCYNIVFKNLKTGTKKIKIITIQHK